MIIKRTHFKGIDASELTDGCLTVIVSDYGAKIQSIRFCGKEYLVQNNESDKYCMSEYGSCFTEGEFSGFDDMFPNISAGVYAGGDFSGTALPDHGEVWSRTWDYISSDGCVVLSIEGIALPYTLQKTVKLSYPSIVLDYTLTNHSDRSFEYIWAAHPLFVLERYTRLELPDASEIQNVFGGQRYLGKDGERHCWPVSNEGRDMSILDPSNGCQNKYYVENERSANTAHIHYPSGAIVTFSTFGSAPYLGVWIDEGIQMNCVAPEPCTGAYDTQERAHNSGRISRIAGGDTCRFGLNISFKGDENK